MSPAPVITTARLRLRPPRLSDRAVYDAFYAASDLIAGGYRGNRSAAEVAAILEADLAHWAKKGFGIFLLEDAQTGVGLGGVGLKHPDGWPRHELTWWLLPEARGRGLATEASRAIIDWAHRTLGWDRVETHMRDENAPARCLAQRLGGRVVTRQTFPDGVARDVFLLSERASALTAAPRLETERLILRGPEPRDAEPMIAFLMDRDHAAGFGASDNRGDAWRWFATNIGHWHLRGYGYFTMELKETGAPIGITGIWNPEGWPEAEVGWALFAAFEGKGYAREGAERARRWAYEDLGFTTLTSNIVPSNTRSKALATRLGAVYERTYQNITMGEDELWRHPGPEALS